MLYMKLIIFFSLIHLCRFVDKDYAAVEVEDTTAVDSNVYAPNSRRKDAEEMKYGIDTTTEIIDIIEATTKTAQNIKVNNTESLKGITKKEADKITKPLNADESVKNTPKLTIEEIIVDYVDYSDDKSNTTESVDAKVRRTGENEETNVFNSETDTKKFSSFDIGELPVPHNPHTTTTPSDIKYYSHIPRSYDNIWFNNSEHKDNDTQPPLELYNLVPAVDYIELTGIVTKTNRQWYVPEMYPCWELPLLYGEIGKKDESEIFAIYPMYLKNVYELEKDNATVTEDESDFVDTRQISKWCSIPPCLGDHTLCLFFSDTYSKTCNEKYVVQSPTVKEQIALVNTLNGMRNVIAMGISEEYPFLPPAANMKQVAYNLDLEVMAVRWLKQCQPGPAPCISLDSRLASQLECIKRVEGCCLGIDTFANCKPLPECFINPVIGCLHTWFTSAGHELQEMHIGCGHIESTTYHTVQMIWANSDKIGCAYARKRSGEIRVLCNFAPGAPFFLDTKYFCGLIPLKDMRSFMPHGPVTDLNYLEKLGFLLNPVQTRERDNDNRSAIANSYPVPGLPGMRARKQKHWGVIALRNKYTQSWLRMRGFKKQSNGSMCAIARLVTRYNFREETQARCDTEEPVYKTGPPASRCKAAGDRFRALCYDFKVATGYRIVAVLAPMVLFSLILYDLFGSVLRQH